MVDGKEGQYRLRKFEKVIQGDVANTTELRQISWNGVPDAFRCTAWMLLLGYIPSKSSRRAAALDRKRKEYLSFARDCTSANADHKMGQEEQDIHRQVRLDVPRTAPDVILFKNERVQRCVERLLCTWACRNPSTSYVQGMNEILVPMFTVFLRGQLEKEDYSVGKWVDKISDEVLEAVEADCYWCLTKFLSSVQDNYTPDQPGIQRMIAKLDFALRQIDPGLWNHFQSAGLDIMHFSFRWMNCFLLHELPLECSIRMFDTYISESRGFSDLHVYVCAALLTRFSRRLRKMDFDEMFYFLTFGIRNMPENQFQIEDLESLISQAFVWQQRFHQTVDDPERKEDKERQLKGQNQGYDSLCSTTLMNDSRLLWYI